MADNIPSYVVVLDPDGTTQSVSDKDLNSEEAVEYYAIKEYLENGTDNETITFTTYSRGLDVNDIVSVMFPEYKIPRDLTKNRIIIRKVKVSYVGAKALDTITGVRYD